MNTIICRLHMEGLNTGMEEGGSGEDDYWQAMCGRALLLETVVTVKRRDRS